MATTKLYRVGSYQGSDNEGINLEMRSDESLYWLKPTGGSVEIDKITAALDAADSVTYLTVNIAASGATPYIQTVKGGATDGNPSGGISWSYSGSTIVLRVNIPAYGSQDEGYDWTLSGPGGPPVKLNIVVKRLAPLSMAPTLMQAYGGGEGLGPPDPRSGADAAKPIVLTRIMIPPHADSDTVAAIMRVLSLSDDAPTGK